MQRRSQRVPATARRLEVYAYAQALKLHRRYALLALAREEQTRLDQIAWEGLRKQLVPTVAIALLKGK